jgi:hypothetical protein
MLAHACARYLCCAAPAKVSWLASKRGFADAMRVGRRRRRWGYDAAASGDHWNCRGDIVVEFEDEPAVAAAMIECSSG